MIRIFIEVVVPKTTSLPHGLSEREKLLWIVSGNGWIGVPISHNVLVSLSDSPRSLKDEFEEILTI